jgi:hypothetical protein
MEQKSEDCELVEALLEAGFTVKTMRTRHGKKVVTVEKTEPREPAPESAGWFARNGVYDQAGVPCDGRT